MSCALFLAIICILCVVVVYTVTKQQLEDTISKEITKFYVKTLGVGPKETRVYIVKDMLIVRLKGKLLPIEEKILESKDGIELVKTLRDRFYEVVREDLTLLIHNLTHMNAVSMHSDVSTRTGERIAIFILETDLESQLAQKNPR